MGFVIAVFVIRTLLIISAKRKYDLKIIEKYGGDYFRSSFREPGEDPHSEPQNTAIDMDLELEDEVTFLKIKKRKQTLNAMKKGSASPNQNEDHLADANQLLSCNTSLVQSNIGVNFDGKTRKSSTRTQKKTNIDGDYFVRQSQETDLE